MILEIVITGLSAFVRDSCDVDKATEMHVLMMEGPMPHNPRLVIEAKYVRASKDKAEWPSEAITLPDGTQYLIWDLTGYRLEIPKAPKIAIYEGHREAVNKKWKSEKPNFNAHPSSDPPEDFSWVPDLDRSCGKDPGTIHIKKDAFDETKLPSKVSARLMKLAVTDSSSNGDNWLEAGIDVSDPKSKDWVFEFNPDYKQILADSAQLRMNVGKVVTLELKLAKITAAEDRIITLQMAGGDVVPLSLSNLPNEHIPYNAGDKINHFTAYWDLMFDDDDKKTCNAPAEPAGIHVQPVKCTLCVSCGPPE